MKQVAHAPRTGAVTVVDVPEPDLKPGGLLIRTAFSVISVGTEISKVKLAEKSLLAKARARPDLVAKVISRARTEGVVSAARIVRDRLAGLDPLGYSAAGVVLKVGEGVAGFAVGDRVACGGVTAGHAEILSVPRNLVAKVPDGVALDSAAFATVGAIAMHGVRQAETTMGEISGVIGLGLIGQLAVRLLRAAGAQVIGIDPDPAAREMARSEAGVFDPADPALSAAVSSATSGRGLDSVLICAAAGDSSPIELAAELARDRAKIVVVGALPVAIGRDVMYEKELDLRIARSYGPGRYDLDYEEHGRDLPPGYVRWTEQRNLEAFLGLLADGRLSVADLITHRYSIEAAAEGYAALLDHSGGQRPFGVVLEYPEKPLDLSTAAAPAAQARSSESRRPQTAGVRVGLIGAGGFARSVLLPALTGEKASLVAVADSAGLVAHDAAHRLGFERVASSVEELLEDETIDAVFIATRHSSHAPLTAEALSRGKAVFVEKPLALNPEELALIQSAMTPDSVLTVDFNRRFAPLTEKLRAFFENIPTKLVSARVNAGPLPDDHWLNDPIEGGGRMIGEGCHFVDLLLDLCGSEPLAVNAFSAPKGDAPLECAQSLSATFRMSNGSMGTLLYTGEGDTRLPKERIEVFGGGASAVIDDFRRLDIFPGRGRVKTERGKQDKGHRAHVAAFLRTVAGEAELPSAETLFRSMTATFAVVESLREGSPIRLA